MRMQFYGKSSPNLVAGVLLIFSLIVLYNYWNVSSFNKDLALKLHTLEQQSISISHANSALQSNLEQTQEEKTNLQLSLRKEQGDEQHIKAQLTDKDKELKKTQNELDKAKKEIEILKSNLDKQVHEKELEINEFKEKIVSLEAQIAEKRNINDDINKQLENAKQLIDKLKNSPASSSTTPTLSKVSNKAAEDEPVLLNDPAVPYPDGWMNRHFSRDKPQVKVKDIGLRGIIPHNSPVIVFDPPKSIPKKARFSVLDPPKRGSAFYRPMQKRPEQQMGPDAADTSPLKPPDKHETGVIPAPVVGEDENNGGEGGVAGAGVLPLPGGAGNLDAAEDDGDHHLKELTDDQSPDGVLSAKELVGVGPAPPGGGKEAGEGAGGGEIAHQSGQDIREAAHLGEMSHNTL